MNISDNSKLLLPTDLKTKYTDSKGIPVYLGDLLRIPHFVAARQRKIYMYKKVMLVNDRVYAVSCSHLGVRPVQECHKCSIEDIENCGKFEIIDGESVRHPWDDTMICWWERKIFRNLEGCES